jgi:AAA+ ATPase superfamily predicted ATPase
MPTFPTYRGELPQCLYPLNLRHNFLLAYWVYFRPTALKCYLYQVDPDLYRAGPGLGNLRRTWLASAYRNLFLMVPAIALLPSLLVGLLIVLVISWLQGTPVKWLGWAFGVALGVTLGAAFSLASGVEVGVVAGVARGVARGVTVGAAVGMAFGAVFGVAFGVAISVAAGLAAGLAFGVTGSVMGGGAGGVARRIANGVAGSVTVGVAFGVVFGVEVGVAFGLAGSIGALRVLFYPLQLGSALCSMFRGGPHPLEWDELVVLPLPGTQRALACRLQQDEREGLRFLADVACNPFQRWMAQRALQAYLHDQPSPIRFLYALLACPDFDAYVFAPVTREDWQLLPTIQQLLLGELDRRWVSCNTEWTSWLAERLVWALTWLLRDRRQTPLTHFAGMLYELLDEQTIVADRFDFSVYTEIYTGLIDYPGGEEIARSFEALATFLSYEDLPALPGAVRVASGLAQKDATIRPTVLTALDRLGQVGAEIATYRDATSRVNQLAALARATDALDDLDEYVLAEVMTPEQYILQRIIHQWRRLVSEAGGEVGRAEEVGPIVNPYVVGNPVSGDLFVGREDILRRLEELWSGEGQKPSVVLYGHRRMGKSSILHNLGARFGPHTVIVDFNMQRVGLVASTGELLYNLALALYDAQTLGVSETPRVLEEPHETRFSAHNPYTAFDRFLKRLDQVRAQRRFIVTVDEFELIEKMISEGQLEPRLLDFWRGLIQTYPWFVMAFAGLHTLQEMTQDYWHPLFGSVIAIPVSFLSHDAAWRLITQPTHDFLLDYDADAVEHIIALTHGQPYLVQLIGHGLVTRFNRQTFEEGVERERRFTLDDVEAVIGAPEFYRDGDAYFTGVWRQAETGEPPEQTAALCALARSEAGIPLEEITRHTGLALEEVRSALETLVRHDVVMDEDGRWQFTVELMRRWVAQR